MNTKESIKKAIKNHYKDIKKCNEEKKKLKSKYSISEYDSILENINLEIHWHNCQIDILEKELENFDYDR